MNENLFLALRDGFPAHVDGTAIDIADGNAGSYTWRELDEASARVARLLDSLSLPTAARVAVQTEKSVETLILYLAVLRCGLVFLPLNTAYQAAEIEYFLKDAAPAVMVCSPKKFDAIRAIAHEAGTRHVYSLGDDRTGTLLAAAAPQSSRHDPALRSAEDPAVILYTSGTTGRSKGALLSHGNLIANARVLQSLLGLAAGRRAHSCTPDFSYSRTFRRRARRTLERQQDDLVQPLRSQRCDRADGGGQRLHGRAHDVRAHAAGTRARCPRPAASMRLFLAGSAPLLPQTFNEWRERTGHTIVERYGMSETVMLTSNPYHAGDGERRAGTVGFPLPGVQLRITDEAGGPCARNGRSATSKSRVRACSVDTGGRPSSPREAFTADGWFRTGDVGTIDEAGYVAIVGRSKDLIISGGFNVYPAEVESYLNELPGVAESAVIGVPHPDFGEAVVAVVAAARDAAGRDAAPDPSALIAELKSKDRELQSAEAGVRGRGVAPQRHGQGAKGACCAIGTRIYFDGG